MRPLGIAAIVLVVLAATAFAVAHFTGQSSSGAAQAGDDRAARRPSATSAASPRLTPAPSASSTSHPSRPSRRRHTAGPRAPATSGPASGTTSAGSATCTKPVFETSSHDPSAGQTFGNYYVTNDMWNASNYSVQQTLFVCSPASWYVVANMNNDSGDGAVKTYPNVHEDFSEPPISSFNSITSTFAESSPHVGIHEDAYDIWVNGVASSSSTEVMVWTDNFHQTPGGSLQGSATFGGRDYSVYRGGSYIAFVAKSNFTAGTVNLLAIFQWIMNKGWMPANSTLGQIDYGVELVSTNGSPATFTFTNFSISTS